MQNKERETEERYQEPSIKLVIKTCGEEIGEIAKSQGSKVQHGSRGKQQRERRKLREKRRSTGVVHLGGKESTGGSTTGEEDGKDETRKITEQNEIMGKDI